MADVIHLINGTVNNGSAVVAANMLGQSYKVSPEINTNQLATTSGVLQYKLDEENTNFTSISVNTGSSGVVDAISGHKIKVLDYVVVSDANCDITFYSGSNAITGTMSLLANGGISNDGESMETNSGEGLLIVTSSGNLGGHLTYRIE